MLSQQLFCFDEIMAWVLMVLGFSSGFWVDSGYRGIFESSFSAFSDLKFKFFYTCGFGGFAPSALLPPHTLRALLLLRPWIWDLNFSLLLSRSRQRFVNSTSTLFLQILYSIKPYSRFVSAIILADTHRSVNS
jgi:hypothetical protein